MSSDDVIKQVQDYLLILQENGIAVTDAYLFGSYAKKTAHRASDIDVCVISSQFGIDRISERVHLMKYTHFINDDLEPHPFSPDDFSDQDNILAQEIKRTGIHIEQ